MAFSLVSSQKYVNRVDFQHPTSSGTPRGTPDEFKARNQIPAGILSQSLSGQFFFLKMRVYRINFCYYNQ